MMMMENQIPLQFPCFNPDPGFVERAAKNSCFGNTRNVVHKLESGKLSRVLSNQSIRVLGVGENSQMDVNYDKKFGSGEFGDSREGSSLSEQNPGGEMGLKLQNDSNSRKRKSISKAKFKESPSSSLAAKDEKVEAENEESNAKRSKPDEEGKRKNTGESNSNKEKQDNNNDKEAPKDYIHVRARRGQATDSHSLAERVRREKISERMKFLQDLVPGCNKVTGKATVLDEIINYVQSLQRQVEFLSMKLATVNPRMEFNMESFLSKDMFQSRGSSLEHTMYPLDQNSAQAFPFEYLSSQQMPQSLPNGVLNNGIENPFSVNTTGIRRNHSIHLPSIDGFNDSVNQLPTFWEDDLQSIVQMGIAQNQTQSLPGAMPNAQMKVEL